MKINQMKESKYISQGDVEGGKVVTVSKLDQENVAAADKPEEIKWILHFKEFQKPLVLNWTNIQLMAVCTGSEDSDDWTGKKVELYVDPTISFGGKIVGGVRIRQASKDAKPTENPAPAFDDPIPGFDD